MLYGDEYMDFIYRHGIIKRSIEVDHLMLDNAIGIDCSFCLDDNDCSLWLCTTDSNRFEDVNFIICDNCMKEFKTKYPNYSYK